MKYFFYLIVSAILFFAFSPVQFTPGIFGNHDKLAHFTAFLVLSFGMKFSFPKYPFKRIFSIMIILAAGIEIVQHYFTNRQLSILDFAAGMAGVFIYIILLKLLTRIYDVYRESLKIPS